MAGSPTTEENTKNAEPKEVGVPPTPTNKQKRSKTQNAVPKGYQGNPVLTVCDSQGQERAVAWTCPVCNKQHGNPKVQKCISCKHPKDPQVTPPQVTPNTQPIALSSQWHSF